MCHSLVQLTLAEFCKDFQVILFAHLNGQKKALLDPWQLQKVITISPYYIVRTGYEQIWCSEEKCLSVEDQ